MGDVKTMDGLLDEVKALEAEVSTLRAEVREWLCENCNTVYPGPPSPGIVCVICPKCDGDTAPVRVVERRRLLAEVDKLRALVAHLTAGCTEVGCPVCLDAKAECGEAAT